MTMDAKTTVVHPPDLELRAALRLAAVFAVVRLLFQFALTLYSSHLGYGYFRDEFYYIACGRHLAWGYVDHGPVVALQARVGEMLFGDSVFALRILPAAAGAITIFLTGILCWALGGKRGAQTLAMLCFFLAPEYIALDGFLSMNCWEPVFWMTTCLGLIMLVRGQSARRWWLVIGVSSGLGLLNKPSMTFFLVCALVGLLCTPERRILFTRWAAVGIALMTALALPNVFWQMHHHWATLEFLHGVANGKNLSLNPLAFFGAQLVTLHPLTALVWVAGIVAVLRGKSIQGMRWVGIAYLVFLPVMWHLHAKEYYLSGFYPVLFAAGAVAWQAKFLRTEQERYRVLAFPVMEIALVVLCGLAVPMASPVLKPTTWLRYTEVMHFRPKDMEKDKTGALPQFYADRFGWQEILNKTAAAFHALPAADQAQACIVTGNYGEAASLNVLGPLEGIALPTAISGHNNYWLWGPNGCTRKVVIVISGDPASDYLQDYRSAEAVGHIDGGWIMPYEHKWIIVARDRKQPYDWNEAKHFD